MRVFVDTSGVYAAFVASDPMHQQAGPTLDKLLDEGAELLSTSYVLLETLALVQARVGLDDARRLEHNLRPRVEIIWIGEDLHTRAFRRLELRDRRELSLVDCASFVVMEEQGLRYAFAYDSHFADEGFRLLGRPEDVGGALGAR